MSIQPTPDDQPAGGTRVTAAAAHDAAATPDGTVEHRPDGTSSVRYVRRIGHPIERVWAALTEPEQLRGWLGEAEVELTDGGAFNLRWLNVDADGNAAYREATIAAIDPPRLLETVGDVHGTLRFELEPDGDATILRFTSTLDLPDEFRTKVLAGWHVHLEHLADALEGRPADWPNWYSGAGYARWQIVHQAYVARDAARSD